ncbi:MAG TPA: DUF4919 domain-containing protein [Pyrinomonadaceae bacterium]|nr:DUF4919 domain-containing protein [Pyrinomonadaceae bacterium]
MNQRFCSALLIALFLALGAATLQAQPKPAQNQKASFADLLQRAKKGDQTLDFGALRFAYTETADYNPYNSNREERQKMFAGINAEQYQQVVASAEIILAKNFVDLNGQFGAFVGNRELGNTQKADLHKFLFEGLVHSIEKSGDGKSPETAFVVISVDEEYVLLNWMGLRATGQELVHQNGHSFDLMKAVDKKTNATVSYYFNIDKPMGWLGKSLKKP